MRILSGIQPSGRLHIGNYFGAMRQYIAAPGRATRLLLHRELPRADQRPRRRRNCAATRCDVALRLLRWASTPSKRRFLRSRTCPRSTELAWLLNCVCADGPAGEVRQLQGQDRQGPVRRPRAVRLPGAAGGRHPHLRLRPRAGRARTRSSTSRSPATSPAVQPDRSARRSSSCPKPYILESVAVVPGVDGRKMSKSYGNTIEIFDEPASDVKKKVKRSSPTPRPWRPPRIPPNPRPSCCSA